VLVGGTGVFVGAAVGTAVGTDVALGPAEIVRAGVGVGLAAMVAVGGPTSVWETTRVLPPVGEGPAVGTWLADFVSVGDGVAVGGKGLSPGARVRVGAGGEVGKMSPNASGVGVAIVPPPSARASTPNSSTGVPLAASV
jgi:hypothetical protein